MDLFTYLETPVGQLKLVASEKGLVAVLWENDRPSRVKLEPLLRGDENEILLKACAQLSEYFAGQRDSFDLALDFRGTEFQCAVWAQLLKIPFGETRSYGEIAKLLGRPGASRAVGAANGRNPISIIAPCHRVIGASGALTGFAGGFAAKKLLLELESRQASS